ncbi:MAG TPA: hypothetical protein VKZ76_07185 [Edaphocola sp.]|nr:hypothetical protein [Edaphocola sp.]
MTKILKYFFDKWWRPLIFFGLTSLIFVISEIIQNHRLIDYSFYLFALGLLGLLISTVYQLTKRNWLFASLTILTFGLGVFVFFILAIAQFWLIQSMPDRYADNLKIPDNIEIFEPKGDGDGYYNIEKETDTLSDEPQLYDFELYRSFQPGLYEYEIWLSKIDSGTVFLKVYEITKNDRLSENRLTKRSSIRVGNTNKELKKFETSEHFTIYEGDWGKPYAARFEVWYQPDKGQERKLTEKNYIIEGWQR